MEPPRKFPTTRAKVHAAPDQQQPRADRGEFWGPKLKPQDSCASASASSGGLGVGMIGCHSNAPFYIDRNRRRANGGLLIDWDETRHHRHGGGRIAESVLREQRNQRQRGGKATARRRAPRASPSSSLPSSGETWFGIVFFTLCIVVMISILAIMFG